MKKIVNKQRGATIYHKSDKDLINEGLMNPYSYNFGLKNNYKYEEGKSNCIHDY